MEAGNFRNAELFNDLLFKSLVFRASHFFDDYLQAVEFGKPLDKKFYQPRRHYLKRYVEAYQEIIDKKLDFLSISMPKRCGKAVTLDTLVPTPFGFKKMGEIKTGDSVIGVDGHSTKVTDVFPQGKVFVYEVKFSDGAVVKTCAEHLWKVKYHNVNAPSNKNGYSTKILTTVEMLEHGLKSKGKNSHHVFAIKYAQPVEFMYREVKLDPYVLGVLLGDGIFRDNTISFVSYDDEVSDYVKTHLPEGDIAYCQDEKKKRWIIKSEKRRTNEKGYLMKSKNEEILDELGPLGKLSYEKHIPDEYLYTTSAMRFALLSGLLDTDGYCSNHRIEYSTTSPYLRDAVIFLVHSLGGKASSSERIGQYKKDRIIELELSSLLVQFHSKLQEKQTDISQSEKIYIDILIALLHAVKNMHSVFVWNMKSICS